MKCYFSADNHAYAYVIIPVNGFGLVNLTDIITCIAGTSYSCFWDSPGAFYRYFEGITAFLHCIMAAFCIYTLLGTIVFNRLNKFNKIKDD